MDTNEKVIAALEALKEEVGSLRREIAILREENSRLTLGIGKAGAALRTVNEAIRYGSEEDKPWDGLPRAKQRQVLAVVDYFRAHPKDSVSVAVRRTFVPSRDGYACAHSLKSWCYRHNIPLFA